MRGRASSGGAQRGEGEGLELHTVDWPRRWGPCLRHMNEGGGSAVKVAASKGFTHSGRSFALSTTVHVVALHSLLLSVFRRKQNARPLLDFRAPTVLLVLSH